MMLDKAYSAPLLKQWLMQKNHEVPLLSSSMTLAKSGNALCWPLDVSACQNDKLIYIAPPKLKGIKDPMGKTPRIQYVRRKTDKLSLSAQAINSTEKNKSLTHKRIDELRNDQGLPKRKYSYKVVGGTEVLLKPDEASITEMKTDRGFVYFNFNGGDSWAYYHPEQPRLHPQLQGRAQLPHQGAAARLLARTHLHAHPHHIRRDHLPRLLRPAHKHLLAWHLRQHHGRPGHQQHEQRQGHAGLRQAARHPAGRLHP
jgi:hypothetical protein